MEFVFKEAKQESSAPAPFKEQRTSLCDWRETLETIRNDLAGLKWASISVLIGRLGTAGLLPLEAEGISRHALRRGSVLFLQMDVIDSKGPSLPRKWA